LRAAGGGGGPAPPPGADILARLDVEFEEAAHGVTRDVEVTRLRTCGECGGTGAAAGSTPETCATCHGAGQVIQRQGFFSIGTTCPRCRGEGVVLTNPCAACGGQGRVPEESSLAVNVPEGIADGMRLRLAGEGEGGRFGGPRGDLYVEVRVKPHAIFGRDGQDVLYKLEVSPARAVMGGKVTVPTLWGDEVLKVPAGAQEGNELTLKGAGMPRLKVRGRGDQRVKVHIRIPKKLGKEEKVLYKKILETEEGKPCED
jgi:molecular chaperone DnaJ